MYAILVLLFIFIAVRNAWISDDAYITLRTVENFRAGYGMGYVAGAGIAGLALLRLLRLLRRGPRALPEPRPSPAAEGLA